MPEVQRFLGASSQPVSSNPSNEDNHNNNQLGTIDGGNKTKLQQLVGDLSTEERLLNLNTPID
jgi:hypothetical protein